MFQSEKVECFSLEIQLSEASKPPAITATDILAALPPSPSIAMYLEMP